MKTNLTRKLKSAVLCLALLAAAIPFAALAQTRSELPDKGEEWTVVIAGMGAHGHFIFRKNTIVSSETKFGRPRNVSVNGASWSGSKEFMLKDTPDFANAFIMDNGGRDDIRLYPYDDQLRLVVGDLMTDRDEKPFRVKLSLKGRTPPDVSMAARKTSRTQHDNGPGIVVLEGTVNDTRNMVFRGDKIYSREDERERKIQLASGISVDRFSVNGVEWEDFDTPFELGFVPDFSSAKIVEKEGLGRIEIVAGKNEAELEIRDQNRRGSQYRVVLSMKKADDGRQTADKPETAAAEKTPATASGAAGKTVAAKQTEDRFTVVLADTSVGNGAFRFHDNRLEFVPDVLGREGDRQYPTGMTVNGKPWESTRGTFYLDTVADYSTGTLVRQTGSDATGWKILSHVDSISASDRRERNMGALSVAGTGQPFEIELSFATFPRDYAARMAAMQENTREKNRIAQLERSYSYGAQSLPLTDRKTVEQYREEQRQERTRWMRDPDYTTDGKALPPVGWASVRGTRKPSPDQFDITIEATVNFVAQFAFQGNRIMYRDASFPNDGNYPSHVKINGKPWKNLHMPFTLDSAIDHDSVLGTQIETEYYRYTLHPEEEWIGLTIINHGPRDEEPVKIKLTVLRSKKPFDNSVIYSGGVPLPAEVLTNPDAFENFWKNAMGGNSGLGASPAETPDRK